MISMKKAAAGFAAAGIAAGAFAFAPAAMAENYAPDLASRNVDAGTRTKLTITGAQAGCRVTYTILNRDGDVVRGPSRAEINSNGVGSSSLKAPAAAGVYRIVTRVDNFPGESGCTPSKSVVRIVVS